MRIEARETGTEEAEIERAGRGNRSGIREHCCAIA